MRINHNLASLNTYRQLTSNNVNTSKSLEKLSSGLRINRAGDDAAGLAISEKMRAQIRGLDQASRNAQDGISLIQTAEGALQETHSILQRMRELATQAANDTNVEVDREEIQKEINQLTSEINRIGETAQFNKITLLKGELNLHDSVTAKVSGGTVTGNVDILNAATSAAATGSELTAANISGIGGPTVTGTLGFTDPNSNDSGPAVAKTSATATSAATSTNNQPNGGTTVTGNDVVYPNHANNDSGPKIAKTSAAITSSAAAADISAVGGTTVTGDVAYADHADADTGPTLTRTAASAQGSSLTAVTTGVIDGYTGPAVTFSKGFTASTDYVGDIITGNNEIQITLNGESATLAIDPADFDGATVGTVQDLVDDLNAAIGASSLTDKGNLTFVLNQENKIELRTSDATDTLAVNGGGLVTGWMLDAPGDTLATTAKTANNKLTMTINGNTQTITLANGNYDFSDAGDQGTFLADVNTKLGLAFGTGAVVASFGAGNKLTFTNALTGTGSTIQGISGSAADLLGLNAVADTHGTENNELRVTYKGTQANLNLTVEDYAAGGTDGADNWLADINAKLDAAFGAGKVVASFSAENRIVFTTAGEGESFSVDGGGAAALIGSTFTEGTEGVGNNSFTMVVNGVSKQITLADGVYDFTDAGDQATLLADLNTKLDAAFGAGNVVASFNNDDELVLTNTLTGTGSTLSNITGNAATALGIAGSSSAGTDNTTLIVSYNGNQQTLNLAEANYSAGGNDSADNWLTDVNAKLDAAYGAGAVVASFNSDNKIVFTTRNNGDTFTVDGGGAESFVGSSFSAGNSGIGNNKFTMTVNGVSKQITLADGVYDFRDAEDQAALLADLNTKLDAAFGAGNVAASFNNDDMLVLTNTLTGTGSTFGSFSGLAAAALGLNTATVEQGTDNTDLTVKYNGIAHTINLTENDYSTGNDDSAADFIADIQSKLDDAFGAGKIAVTFDAENKVVFTAASVSDTLTIEGGGAAALLKADPSDAFEVGISGTGNNELTMTVNGITKSITLADGSYDFSLAGDKATFLNDLNSKLNTAFGTGNVTASFNADRELVFTNNLTGAMSTLANLTGSATSALGLTAADYVAGKNANNTGTITVDGHAVTISLAAGTYSKGALAAELQTQIRDADAALANTTVDYADGSFVITSGSAGSEGSLTISASDLASTLKLTANEGAVSTAGTDAVDNGIKLQVGANAEQSISVDMSDMRSQALKVSGAAGGGEVESSDHKTAHYVEIANVTNGINNVNIEYALDVSASENATAAISVIDDAIQVVSAERSKLGAFQNRLEHTINNLGTSSENLTAAESRIRDVDMAKEMMEFTKNNILTQAAQAMLAQANQQPQGVLQLLR